MYLLKVDRFTMRIFYMTHISDISYLLFYMKADTISTIISGITDLPLYGPIHFNLKGNNYDMANMFWSIGLIFRIPTFQHCKIM